MTDAAPRRPRRLGQAVLAGYAVLTAIAGVTTAVAAAPRSAPTAAADPAALASAGALADGTLAAGTEGRPVTAAPLLPAEAGGRASTSVPPTARVTSAAVAPDPAAGTTFRPLVLALPGGVTAPIQKSGVHPDGSLVIPDDPATVGWWSGGALAGDPFGSVVIAGHVDSARYGLGVMARLKTLKAGQVVELRAGDRRVRYRVGGRQSVPQADLAARSDAFAQDVPPRLVLITCGGAFDRVRHRYQENLLIYATPLPTR